MLRPLAVFAEELCLTEKTFDGILNVTLSTEKVSTTGVTQGNCYLGEFILLILVLFKN